MNQNMLNYSAWDLKPEMYPRDGGAKEQIAFLLRYGVLAPSTHNSQPWRFKFLSPSEIRIDPDWSRALPYSDADNRGLFFSQGCCLQNILVAADYFGWTAQYEYKGNDPHNGYILVRFNQKSDQASKTPELLEAIVARQSHKLRFGPKPVKDDLLESLRSIQYGDAQVAYTTQKSIMAKLIDVHMKSMLGYMKNKRFAKEVSSWMRASQTKRHDGMPGFTFGLGSPQSVFAKFMTGITPKSIKVSAKKDMEVLNSSSAIGAVLTKHDDYKSWIDAGLAYQKAGVLMAVHGVRLAPKAAAVESGDGAELAKLLGSDLKTQLYFGIGYGDGVMRHSPRRYISMHDVSKLKQEEQ